MSTTALRREIKKAVDRLPPERLSSLADYVHFLTRPELEQRVAAAERAIASGKGVNWRRGAACWCSLSRIVATCTSDGGTGSVVNPHKEGVYSSI